MYRIEHCEANWQTTESLFDSEFCRGFARDNLIEDYQESLLTNTLYLHYHIRLPNENCRMTMSGNYRLHVREDGSNDDVLTVEIMVTEQSMQLSMAVTTNTDIDTNDCHQQLTMAVNYRNIQVIRPEEQIQTVVMQNGREDNCRRNVRPSFITNNSLEWGHARELIFDAGNEYRKFEVLDPSHPTMGIDYIRWDGDNYQVFPFLVNHATTISTTKMQTVTS